MCYLSANMMNQRVIWDKHCLVLKLLPMQLFVVHCSAKNWGGTWEQDIMITTERENKVCAIKNHVITSLKKNTVSVYIDVQVYCSKSICVTQ